MWYLCYSKRHYISPISTDYTLWNSPVPQKLVPLSQIFKISPQNQHQSVHHPLHIKKPHFITIQPIFAEFNHLAMSSILQLTYTAGSVRQLKNKWHSQIRYGIWLTRWLRDGEHNCICYVEIFKMFVIKNTDISEILSAVSTESNIRSCDGAW